MNTEADTAPRALTSLSVAEFAELTASGQPAPAGGSATALAGALAAALAAMVARLTAGRERYADYRAEMIALCDEADALRGRLLALVDADARAYEQVLAAYRLPQETASQRTRRTGAIQTALRGATETPLAVAGACRDVLALAATAAAHGNRNTTSDAQAGAWLAYAGLQAAAINVRTNLALIHEAHDRGRVTDQLRERVADGEAALARALAGAPTGA